MKSWDVVWLPMSGTLLDFDNLCSIVYSSQAEELTVQQMCRAQRGPVGCRREHADWIWILPLLLINYMNLGQHLYFYIYHTAL